MSKMAQFRNFELRIVMFSPAFTYMHSQWQSAPPA